MLLENMCLGTVLNWEVRRILDSKLRHQFLLLCWPRLPGTGRDIDIWGRLWCNRHPLMEFLSEEIGLVREKDFGPFNFAKIETHSWNFSRSKTKWIVGV